MKKDIKVKEAKMEDIPVISSEASINKKLEHIPDKVITALQKIVDYLHLEEYLNYAENPDEDHIFLSIKIVENWLDTSKTVIRCQKECPEIPSIKCRLPKGHSGWCASDQDREVMWG